MRHHPCRDSDVHGSFSTLVDGLRQINFDPQKDRLFSVGDTIDRGSESLRALKFLQTPWVNAVLGNHEEAFLDLYHKGELPDSTLEAIISGPAKRNGMSWWLEIPREQRLALIAEFRKLPIVIEVETERGTVGLIHGEVPMGMDWKTFTAAIERGDEKVTEQALWGRTRISHGDTRGVAGIGRVFCGHTPVNRPTRLGNVYYVDTGAVFGVLNENPGIGRLTLAELSCGTMVMERDSFPALVDVRLDEEPTSAPFGAYAKG